MNNSRSNTLKHRSSERNGNDFGGYSETQSAAMSTETSPSCLFKKHEATRDSIRSRGVLAAILLLLDAHGESLANPFNDNSPFSKVPTNYTESSERECPMTGCQEHFSTPLTLINHLLLCRKARKGNVNCGKCEETHGMTRLMSPTQLWRKVVGKRSRNHGPGLTPPSLDGSPARKSVPSLELMGDMPDSEWTPELEVVEPCSEIDTGGELPYSSFGTCHNSAYSSGFVEKPAQPSLYGLHRQGSIQEMAVVEPILELDAPLSHHPSFPAPTPATPWQGASRSWSRATGASHAPTLYEVPREEDFDHQASARYNLQEATCRSSNLGDMAVPQEWNLQNIIPQESLPQGGIPHRNPQGSQFADNASVTWLPEAPLTLPSKPMVPEVTVDEAMWTMDSSPDVQSYSGDALQAFDTAPNSQLPKYNTAYIHGPYQASWQPSFTSLDPDGAWTSSPPAAAPFSHVVSLMSAGSVAQSLYASWQPYGSAGAATPVRDPTANATSYQTSSELDSEPSPPDGQPLARRNAFRAPGPLRPASRSPEKRIVVASSPHIIKCGVSGCEFRPTGKKKNLKPHLKRHMESRHSSERLQCPVPGCSKTIQNGRQDNLRAHVKKHSSLGKRKRSLEGTTIVAECDLGDDHGKGGAAGDLSVDAGGYQAIEIDDILTSKGGNEFGNLLGGMADHGEVGGLGNFGDGPDPFLAMPSVSMSAERKAHLSQLELEFAETLQLAVGDWE